MVKSKLVRVLNEKLPERQIRDVELALNCMLGQMADALAKGQRIEIRGFGSFDLHHRPPRIARNPKTGEAGKEMRDRVDAAREQCGIME